MGKKVDGGWTTNKEVLVFHLFCIWWLVRLYGPSQPLRDCLYHAVPYWSELVDGSGCRGL